MSIAFIRHEQFQRTMALAGAGLCAVGALAGAAPELARVFPGVLGAVALGAAMGAWAGAELEAVERRALLIVTAGAAAGLAFASITRLEALGVLAAWTPPLRGAALGLLGAAVMGLGLLPRHVALGAVAVTAALPAAAAELPEGEARDLGDRAGQACATIHATLAGDTSAEAAAARTQTAAFSSGVGRLCRRLADLDRALGSVEEPVLRARRDEASTRAAAAEEPATRLHYERAAKGFDDQLARVARLRADRERVLARLFGDVATLERVALALLGRRAAAADRDGALLGPLVAELGQIGDAIEVENDASAAATQEIA